MTQLADAFGMVIYDVTNGTRMKNSRDLSHSLREARRSFVINHKMHYMMASKVIAPIHNHIKNDLW